MKKIIIFSFLIIILFCSCNNKDKRKVYVYTSVDQVYSEPVLREFEEVSGIQVFPVYDVEAAKTTGLVNRLIAEKNNPVADVFWNGEFVQTILLKEKGVLSPYFSVQGNDIPKKYKDPEGCWTGFGGRARVILVNTDLIEEENYPSSIFDLLDSKYGGEKIGISYPLFGTGATQASALYALLGPEEARNFYSKLNAPSVSVLPGNSTVRDYVADGSLIMGLTDTDDACAALEKGAPVAIIFPDQGEDAIGTLIVPNTVALIEGAPHSEEGKILIDYLLSKEVEKKLVKTGWTQISLRDGAVTSEWIKAKNIKGMDVTLSEIYDFLKTSKKDMGEIFVR